MNSSYGFEGEVKHKHGEQTYKASVPLLRMLGAYSCWRSFSLKFSQHVRSTFDIIVSALLTHLLVPLATLISATKPPSSFGPNTIVSPEGYKRYFVVHGGLFSKDDVTLEDIRKINRFGRQPGQEGLMCLSSVLL